MDRPKARVFVALFTYGGNGGIASMSPDLCLWLMRFYHEAKTNPQIDFLGVKNYSDTPITMVRCLAVEDAKALKADMILMLDSDNIPDGYVGHYEAAKPFFPTAFEFAYERLLKGIPTVIAAPYCGPPPPPVDEPGVEHGGEVPYLFEWADKESDFPDGRKRLSILTRNHASRLAGIYPVAALPTGVCLFTLKAFEGLKQPYFRYEMDPTGSRKNSTEDVVATRDISLFWKITKGYDVLFAACDSWALHVKTKKVGRPQHVPIESISEDFADAIRRNWAASEELRVVDYGGETQNPVVNFNFDKTPEKPAVAFSEKQVPEAKPVDVSRLKRRWDVLGPDDDQVFVSDEEWREIESQVQMESQVKIEEKPQQQTLWKEEPPLPKAEPLTSRMIGRHKVRVVGEKLPDEAVEAIQNLASYVSEKAGGPIKAAVVKPGTGEGTAALLSVLPSESRIHAYNWADPSTAKSEYFKEAFQKELDEGVVKADLDGKQAPDMSEHWSDLALFEGRPDESQLERWMFNVSPRGLLCGVGYDSPEVREVVDKFKEEYSLPVQVQNGVWAIPVGDLAHA